MHPPEGLSFFHELRGYQEELFQEILLSWGAGKRRLLLQLPTGAGKTVVFSRVARKFTQSGMGVLVLAHREELLLQAQETIEAITGQVAGFIKAGYPANPEHSIQLASVQTLVRRQDWPKADLVNYR